MTCWYSLTPASPIALGNLTPVGQNSGQVGCRWPPNGHQLAACLDLPSRCQLWGPFWYFGNDLYLLLPQPVYTLDTSETKEDDKIPENIYRFSWNEAEQLWQVHPDHQREEIEVVGGRYLIRASALRTFWKTGAYNNPPLVSLPWQTLTLSQNRRKDFQVVDEGGFFAEMTTLMDSGWSMAVKVIGDYEPPPWAGLGAGSAPVVISPLRRQWDWLGADCPNAKGAILLTGALWQKGQQKVSCPYPAVPLKAYAAETGIPWQSWKKVRDRHNPSRRVRVLTPGEWMTPAGAVYLWEGETPLTQSGPFPDPYHRDALGYGHLWLFE